jgi:hypothetical protein
MLSKLLVLLQAILLVSGCAAFMGFPSRVTDRSADLEALQSAIDANAIKTCLDVKVPNDAEACRNKLIAARTYAVDIQFSAFEEDLFRQAREAGFAATLATLGLTAAGAVAGGGTTQVLSAIAAGITGSRAAFEREVLAERTVLAIHTSMRANRMIVLARIRRGLTQSVSDYPLAAGLTDVEDYYFQGTVLGALIGITKAVGVEAKEAERLLRLAPLSTTTFEPKATADRQAMLAKVDGLSRADAIALVTKPPAPINDDMRVLAETIDPLNQRQHNETVAKAVLKAWLSHSVEVEDYSKWAAAMGVVPNASK